MYRSADKAIFSKQLDYKKKGLMDMDRSELACEKPMRQKNNILKNTTFTILLAIVVTLIVGAIFDDSFVDAFNLSRLLRQASILGLIAVGMTFVIIGGNGGIDLSVGAIFGLGCIISISLQKVELQNTGSLKFTGVEAPIWIIFVVCIIAGALIGYLNGAACAYLKLPPFISTLCMMNIVRGSVMVYTNGFQFIGVRDDFSSISNGFVFDIIPNTLIVLLFIGVIAFFVLHRSAYGRKVFAIGANIKAASISGINTKRIQISTYIISGILAAVAAVFYTSFSMSGDPKAGSGYEMDAITAVLIGGTPLVGGKGTVVGTLLGLLFIYLLRNLLTHLDINTYIQQLLMAILILVVVLVQQNTNRKEARA